MLIASWVLIRDVYTVTLLLTAQLVCVLLGFAVEAANATGTEAIVSGPVNPVAFVGPAGATTTEPGEVHLTIAAAMHNITEIDFSDTESAQAPSELANLITPPPEEPPTPQEIEEQKQERQKARLHRKQNARKSFGLWLACFLATGILHAAVWYILLTQLSNVVNETDCQDSTADSDTDAWKTPVSSVVYSQLILFILFGLVPLLQELAFFRGTSAAGDVFLYGSIAYAILSVIAKVTLASTYIAFVELFPFKTRS